MRVCDAGDEAVRTTKRCAADRAGPPEASRGFRRIPPEVFLYYMHLILIIIIYFLYILGQTFKV